MKISIQYAPVNSSFFFVDKIGGIPPEVDDRSIRAWASGTCLIVACLMSQDGDTHLTLSDVPNDAPAETPLFECDLATPSKILRVVTSGHEVLMEVEAPRVKTHLQVWTNHPSEPDKIFVLLS